MHIVSLFTGKVKPLANTTFQSAIGKKTVVGPVKVSFSGLDGDYQADQVHHGGFDKSIHQYNAAHYLFWIKLLGETYRNKMVPGGFGENISSSGMDETTVCIGDRYRVGSVVLEVSQARQPCWKLNYRFGHPEISRLTQDHFKTGWYYRVLGEGELNCGDGFELLERPFPFWPLQRLLHVLYNEPLNFELVEEMMNLKPLAKSWKNTLMQRLETHKVESWEKRLYNR